MRCKRCGEEKAVDAFCTTNRTLCKSCRSIQDRTTREVRRRKDPKVFWSRRALTSARKRATKAKLSCTVTEELLLCLIRASNRCPICEVEYGFENTPQTKQTSPSLDRILPEEGYIPENVQVICNKCNSTKNDTSLEKMRSFVKMMRAAKKKMGI